MNAISKTTSPGNSNLRASRSYAAAPESARACVQMWSTKKQPSGTTPESAWSCGKDSDRRPVENDVIGLPPSARATIARDRRRTNSVLRSCIVTIALVVPACGGGSRASEVPVPALSATVEAQRAYRQIESRWTDLPPERRGELEPDLRDFLNRFAADDRARLVRSLLAWLEIDQKRPDMAVTPGGARSEKGPPGAARDFAGVVEARALLQQGKVVEALGLLQPLRGKLVDPEVRRAVLGRALFARSWSQ